MPQAMHLHKDNVEAVIVLAALLGTDLGHARYLIEYSPEETYYVVVEGTLWRTPIAFMITTATELVQNWKFTAPQRLNDFAEITSTR